MFKSKSLTTLFAATSLLAAATFSMQAIAETVTLTVTINKLSSKGGTLLLAGYTDATSFQSYKDPVFSSSEEAEGKSMTFKYEVEEGNYALSVMQDLNNNDQFDLLDSGMPGEPYGYTLNESGLNKVLYGPPSFQDAVIDVDGDTSVEINLR